VFHVCHVGGVPAAKIRIEGRSDSKHVAHVFDNGSVPRSNASIDLLGSIEHGCHRFNFDTSQILMFAL
jgi:hypothetical protein